MAKDDTDWLDQYAQQQGLAQATPYAPQNMNPGPPDEGTDTLVDLPNGGSVIQNSADNTAALVQRPQAYANTINTTDPANDIALYKQYMAANPGLISPAQAQQDYNVPPPTPQTPEWLTQYAQQQGFEPKPSEEKDLLKPSATRAQGDLRTAEERPLEGTARGNVAADETADAAKAARYAENAKRIAEGRPTVEEEYLINAKRMAQGLPTIQEQKAKHDAENAKRIAAGKPTIEEEARKRGVAPQASWLGDKIDSATKGVEHYGEKAADWIGSKLMASKLPELGSDMADVATPSVRPQGNAFGEAFGPPPPPIPTNDQAKKMRADGDINQDQLDAIVTANAASPADREKMAASWAVTQQPDKPEKTETQQLASQKAELNDARVVQAQKAATAFNPDARDVYREGTPADVSQAPPQPTETGPVHMATAAGSAAAGAPVQPQGGSLNIPQSRVVGGGWANLTPPQAQGQFAQYQAARNEDLGQASVDARLANQQAQQFYAKRTADLQAQQDAQKKQMWEAQAARDKAQDTYEQAQKVATEAKVDPDKTFGPGFGGHLIAGIAAALGAFGAALTHTPNFALEIIKNRVQESLDAQKAEMNSKHKTADNAYSRLLAATGDERSADSAFKQAGYATAESQAQELGAGAKDAELLDGLRAAQLAAQKEDYTNTLSTMGRVPAQQAGGITPADIARSRAIRDKAAENREQMDPTESMRQALAERLVPQDGGFQSYAKPQKDAQASARAAGTAAHYENMINEAQTGLEAVRKLKTIVGQGGQISPTLRAEVKNLNERSISSMAAVLQNGQTPTTESREAARKQHPDLPSATEITGADARQLELTEQFYLDKLRQAKATKTQLGSQPWGSPEMPEDVAADVDAK